ncbi:lysophospholipid acyltransferase family protein [archaeon]|nr:MAG: lysophospholipid acyltransferase family protein [archaeon]
MKGFLLIVSLTLAVASMFFYLFPSVILVFFSHFPFILRLRQQINLQLNEIYFEFAAFLLYYLCSIKVILHLSDKSVLQDQSFLVICNHRSTVDMMFTAWCYATFLDTYPHLLFILKDTLRSLPFFGYCMQILMYIFLSRKKEQDVPHIHSMLGYMSRNYCAAQSVVIFPEGTDLSPSNILKNTQCKWHTGCDGGCN